MLQTRWLLIIAFISEGCSILATLNYRGKKRKITKMYEEYICRTKLLKSQFRKGKIEKKKYKIIHNDHKKNTEKDFEIKEPGIIRDAKQIRKLTLLGFVALILAFILSMTTR
jgi:hypothetical protein